MGVGIGAAGLALKTADLFAKVGRGAVLLGGGEVDEGPAAGDDDDDDDNVGPDEEEEDACGVVLCRVRLADDAPLAPLVIPPRDVAPLAPPRRPLDVPRPRRSAPRPLAPPLDGVVVDVDGPPLLLPDADAEPAPLSMSMAGGRWMRVLMPLPDQLSGGGG